jgi:hypothetical protein
MTMKHSTKFQVSTISHLGGEESTSYFKSFTPLGSTITQRKMKEPLVSKLTIPHTSPLYKTGNNIFMKHNTVPLLRKLSPWQIFRGAILSMLNPIHVFTPTDNFSKFHVNQIQQMRELYRWQNIKKLTKSPSQKSDPLDRFFWKSIPSMLLLLLTTSQSFVYIHPQM